MFRLAHFSDPHLGPLPQPRLRDLVGKRATGYANWRRGRAVHHDMTILDRLVADVAAARPDHVAVTGDFVNIGLSSEFPQARAFLERVGACERVTAVPGNHDAYVRGSLDALLRAAGAWMTGDGEKRPSFPFVRRVGPVALIGVSTAVPTPPFIASGRLGPEQRDRLEQTLAALAGQAVRILLIHHAPYRDGSAIGRNLTDARDLEALLLRTGCDLVLHGHNHVTSLRWLDGPGGSTIPALGAPSASARNGSDAHRAGWHLIEIGDAGSGAPARISATTRTLLPDGSGFRETGRLDLSGGGA
jgi:3',5'-cyclic AMP phosphodiesterase CpdA